MIILPYNIEQPTTGDRGSVFFPILERGLQRLSSHDHDGVNSALINAAFSDAGVVSVLSANWTVSVPGVYIQTVTLPASFDFDNTQFELRLASGTYEVVYASIKKISATQVQILSAINTVSYLLICK
jgi:hypothetical protein